MPEFPGEHGGKVFGVPPWAAILALAGAGVVGYLIFFRNQGSSSGGGGSTGYSPYALAVMQNPDESAAIAEQSKLITTIGQSVTNGFVSVGSSLNSIGGQIGEGFAGVHDQVGGQTMMNYYQSAYYYGQQQATAARGRGDTSGANGWDTWAKQFLDAIEQGRKAGYGTTPSGTTPNYYGQPHMNVALEAA